MREIVINCPIVIDTCLSWGLCEEELTMAMATLIKENIYLGQAYCFKGFVHYQHGEKLASLHAIRHDTGEGDKSFTSPFTDSRRLQHQA